MSDTVNPEAKRAETLQHLRDQLREISDKKEFWFQKKETLKKSIKEKVQQLRDYKALSDQRTVELKTLKAQRDRHNDEVKNLIGSIKKLNKQKYKVLKEYNIRIDPAHLLEKINSLEHKVEIETDYEREKKLMEGIKKLKKVYDECAAVFALGEEARKIDTQIKESRAKADEFHRKVLDLTKDNDYNTFITISKEITELKKTQEEAFQIFIEHKNSYLKTVQAFNEQLQTLQAVRDQVTQQQVAQKAAERERLKIYAQERAHEVEEKIKLKKRLTTEDILAFQSTTEA